MIDDYAKPSAIPIAQGLNQGLLPLIPDGITSLRRDPESQDSEEEHRCQLTSHLSS